MNKLIGIKTLMFSAITALFFVSCSEDQTSLSIDDIQGKATLIGSFTYDDNQSTSSSSTSSATSEKPVMNTTVYVKIANSSLDPKENATGYTVYETTTDANGEYKIEIPVVETGTEVTIQAESFVGKRYESTGFGSTNTTVTTKEGVYEVQEVTLSGIKPHDIKVVGKKKYHFTAYDGTYYY